MVLAAGHHSQAVKGSVLWVANKSSGSILGDAYNLSYGRGREGMKMIIPVIPGLWRGLLSAPRCIFN